MHIIPSPRPTGENATTWPPPCPAWCADEHGHGLGLAPSNESVQRLHYGSAIDVGDLQVGVDVFETVEPGCPPRLDAPSVTLNGNGLTWGCLELSLDEAAELAAALTDQLAHAHGAALVAGQGGAQ